MTRNYFGKVPRIIIGVFFDMNRPIWRCRRFIFLIIWLCFNVFLVIDILVSCGYFAHVANDLIPSSSSSPPGFSLKPNKLDVRLLCWTTSVVGRENLNSIRETWGKRCDKLIFITNLFLRPKENTTAGTVWLFARTTDDVLKHFYDHHFDDSDWFLKADARTYVVVEELKLMLSNRNPATPCYLAANNSDITKRDYVLSRESVRRLVLQSRRLHPAGRTVDCNNWSHPISSHCLDRLGIVSFSTLDERGCERFVGTNLATELITSGDLNGRCISDKVVIFAHLDENDFYFYEHLLYRLKMPIRKIPNVT